MYGSAQAHYQNNFTHDHMHFTRLVVELYALRNVASCVRALSTTTTVCELAIVWAIAGAYTLQNVHTQDTFSPL